MNGPHYSRCQHASCSVAFSVSSLRYKCKCKCKLVFHFTSLHASVCHASVRYVVLELQAGRLSPLTHPSPGPLLTGNAALWGVRLQVRLCMIDVEVDVKCC